MQNKRYNNKNFKCAFTLAETLITLVIIGIVAALTIPAIMHKRLEEEAVAKVTKIYRDLSATIQKYQLDNGCIGHISYCDISNTNAINNIIRNYMKIAQFCIGNCGQADWLPDKDILLTGAEQTQAFEGVSKLSNRAYLLNDGTIISMYVESDLNILIFVDINGKKKPNRVGKDVFPMTIGARHGNIVDTRYTTISPFLVDDTQYGGICTIIDNNTTCNPDVCLQNNCSPTAYLLKNKKLPPISW